MNGTKSPLWSSVAILIGVVIGIFAVTTGKLRQSLLIAAMLVWICAVILHHLDTMVWWTAAIVCLQLKKITENT